MSGVHPTAEEQAKDTPSVRAHLEICAECQQKKHARELETRTVAGAVPAPIPVGPSLERGARAGRYIIISKLGEGGMGEVYEGYDPELSRRVALKVLHQKLGGAESAALLIREAQALAQLSHPNVVAVYDVQHLSDGSVCMAMELLEGQTLREWDKAKRHSWQEALDVMLAAGDGLAAAHRAGLVHRDFKPSNVLVAKDGRVRVLDFGLARISSAEAPVSALVAPSATETETGSQGYLRAPLTQLGSLPGTLAYMAPEQFRGAPASIQTDVFSFGVTLFELLFGVRPFRHEGASPAQQWVVAVPPGGRGVPRAVTAVVMRALSLEPSQRPVDLPTLLEGLRDARAARTRRRIAAATVALLGLAAALVVDPLGLWRTAAPCTGAEQRFAALWGPAQKNQMLAAFTTAAAGPLGADSFARTSVVLDAWAHDWVRGQTAACEDTRVRKEVPESMLALRMSCYDTRRRSFAALVEVLAHADREVVINAARAAHELPPIQRCDDLALLQVVGASAVAAGARPVPAEARDALEKARAQIAAGKMAAARPFARQALDAAVAAGALDFEADAAWLLGIVEEDLDQVQGSALLEQSARAALAAGDDEQLFESFYRLAATAGNIGDTPGERRWLELADAALWRRPDRATRVPLVQSLRADLYTVMGEHEKALALCREVRTALERSTLPPLQLASTLNQLGNALYSVPEFSQAADAYEKSYRLRKQVLGPGHLDTLKSQANLANVYASGLSRLDEALPLVQDIWKQCEANGLDRNLFCLTALGNQADVLGQLGRYDEAIPLFERGYAGLRESISDAALPVLSNRCDLGRTLLLKGDLAGAAAVFENLIAKLPNDDPSAVTYTNSARAMLGQALWRGGQKARGLALMEAGLKDVLSKNTEPFDTDMLRFALAQAVSERGERDRAVALAREAAEGFSARKKETERAAVEAWLLANAPR